jgi:hypothetical protein
MGRLPEAGRARGVGKSASTIVKGLGSRELESAVGPKPQPYRGAGRIFVARVPHRRRRTTINPSLA